MCEEHSRKKNHQNNRGRTNGGMSKSLKKLIAEGKKEVFNFHLAVICNLCSFLSLTFFLQNIMAGAAVYFPSAFDCTVVPPRNMTSPYASCGLT